MDGPSFQPFSSTGASQGPRGAAEAGPAISQLDFGQMQGLAQSLGLPPDVANKVAGDPQAFAAAVSKQFKLDAKGQLGLQKFLANPSDPEAQKALTAALVKANPDKAQQIQQAVADAAKQTKQNPGAGPFDFIKNFFEGIAKALGIGQKEGGKPGQPGGDGVDAQGRPTAPDAPPQQGAASAAPSPDQPNGGASVPARRGRQRAPTQTAATTRHSRHAQPQPAEQPASAAGSPSQPAEQPASAAGPPRPAPADAQSDSLGKRVIDAHVAVFGAAAKGAQKFLTGAQKFLAEDIGIMSPPKPQQ